MKTIQSIAAAFAFTMCAAATAGTAYQATSADTDLQGLMTRWAMNEGKKLAWEANGNAAIKDADALNTAAQLSKADSFEHALARLNKALETVNWANPAKARTLKACSFSDTIVIRTIDQAACGSPL